MFIKINKVSLLLLLVVALPIGGAISNSKPIKPISWSIEYPQPTRAVSTATTEEPKPSGRNSPSRFTELEQYTSGLANNTNNQQAMSLEELVSKSLAQLQPPLWSPADSTSFLFSQRGEMELDELANNLSSLTPIWSTSKLDYLTPTPNSLFINPTQVKHRTIDQMLSILNPQIRTNLDKKQTSNLKNTWTKPFSSKRRSYEPLLINDAHIAKMVKFDDNLEQQQQEYKPAKDFLSRLPLLYETPAASNIAPATDKESVNLFVDNLLASSRYSGISQPMPYYHAAYLPVATGHKYTLSSRKGFEKSLGFPILIGIGAALISFLILSNLFLSIPLLAMTLMQFFNGNNMLMPNNNPNNNNQNNGSNGQTTSGRKRRRRDIHLEELIQRALGKDY